MNLESGGTPLSVRTEEPLVDHYRLDVITDSVRDAIQHAGGLMFDRARAGWRVVVVTDDAAHPRALAILGVQTQAPRDADEQQHAQGREQRTTVSRLGGFGPDREPNTGARLLRWDHPGPGASTCGLQPLAHPLSAAARAFKAHALHSAGLDVGPDADVLQCEHFWADSAADTEAFANPVGSRSSTVVGGWPGG